MSFSGEVKKELAGIIPSSRHCQIAEIAAFMRFSRGNRAGEREETGDILLQTEQEETASLLFTLFQRAYNIYGVVDLEQKRTKGRGACLFRVPGGPAADAVRQSVSHPLVLQLACCKKAFLRGAFLAVGSVSAPEKSYHLELVAADAEEAELLKGTMARIGLEARTVLRKGASVVYMKEGDRIVEFLGAMGGSNSFLSIETVRVMKEMRGSVNRRVNCETANLNKTIVSSVRQIEDIRYIRDHGGFGALPPALREMAEVRLDYPEAPLAELGQYLDPPIGKSGVNHRLRKLSGIAALLREEDR